MTTPTPRGLQHVVDAVRDLRGQLLLHLEAARVGVDHARELADADDLVGRQVADVRAADDRRHVVLAVAIRTRCRAARSSRRSRRLPRRCGAGTRADRSRSRRTSRDRPRRRAWACRAGLRARDPRRPSAAACARRLRPAAWLTAVGFFGFLHRHLRGTRRESSRPSPRDRCAHVQLGAIVMATVRVMCKLALRGGSRRAGFASTGASIHDSATSRSARRRCAAAAAASSRRISRRLISAISTSPTQPLPRAAHSSRSAPSATLSGSASARLKSRPATRSTLAATCADGCRVRVRAAACSAGAGARPRACACDSGGLRRVAVLDRASRRRRAGAGGNRGHPPDGRAAPRARRRWLRRRAIRACRRSRCASARRGARSPSDSRSRPRALACVPSVGLPRLKFAAIIQQTGAASQRAAIASKGSRSCSHAG